MGDSCDNGGFMLRILEAVRMKMFRGSELVIPVFLAGFMLVLLSNPALAAIYNCNSCSACNTHIQAAADGDTVRLTASISNYAGTCIDFAGKDNIIFDCQGNTIDGDRTGTADYGILLGTAGSTNNTITNCNIRDFSDGIYMQSPSSGNMLNTISSSSNTNRGIMLYGSDNNVLTSVIANSNVGGLYIYSNANNNTVTSSFFNSNSNWGVDIYSSPNNTLSTVTASENANYDVLMESPTVDSH